MVSRLDALVVKTKRIAQREQKIQAGIAALDQWLQDLMRQGLATVQAQPYQLWEEIAARMVDAQAPGLARRLRRCGSIPYSGEGWPQRLAEALGQIYLLLQGYQQLTRLPLGLQAEVRAQVGWTLKKDEVLAIAQTPSPSEVEASIPKSCFHPSLPLQQFDHWQVVGLRVTEDDQLWSRRVWLWGIRSDRPALILDFSYGRPTFDQSGITLVPGLILPADLVFYPSSYPLRALVQKISGTAMPMVKYSCGLRLTEAIAYYGRVLSHNPWLDQMPLILTGVLPVQTDSQWIVVDGQGQGVSLHPQFAQPWELLAISSGRRVAIAAEWDGQHLWPLSVGVDQPESRLIVF